MLNETPTYIQPFEEIVKKTITSFKVSINYIEIFKYANLNIVFFDSNNNLVKACPLDITGEDYANWGNNDEYIINYVANYYGFVIIPPPQQE